MNREQQCSSHFWTQPCTNCIVCSMHLNPSAAWSAGCSTLLCFFSSLALHGRHIESGLLYVNVVMLSERYRAQVGHASAQTNVNTFILEVAVNNTAPTEGQLQTYGLQIETAQGQPAPQGTVYWLNGTTILAQANLNTGTLINGNVTVRHPKASQQIVLLSEKDS